MRVAINVYVIGPKEKDKITDVSEAVDEMLRVVVQSRLGALVTSEPDQFRRGYCYSEPVCNVLKANELVLHEVFDFIRGYHAPRLGERPRPSTGPKPKHINLKSWLTSLKALQVVNIDLSERDCMRCFSWSRMAVGDYKKERGLYESTHLPFEGFLEALCRIAAQKALPTEEDLQSTDGMLSCFAFLEDMRTCMEAEYKRFLQERCHPWTTSLPTVGFEVRVKYVISVFVGATRRHLSS